MTWTSCKTKMKSEHIFNNVDDSNKIKLLDGTVLYDTAIIPDFCDNMGIDHTTLWNNLMKVPDHDPNSDIEFDPEHPTWITGEHPSLHYRGHALLRKKLWLQKEVDDMLKYGYTGWQHRISKALHKTSSIPGLDEILNKINELLHYKHNHWIATCYEDKDDNISLHSDKVQNWVPDSCFIIIKVGAPRRFQVAQPVQMEAKGRKPMMKDVVIFDKVIQPGTAIIVGMDANTKIKHGVPRTENVDGPSGSIVGRAILTKVPWEQVDRNIQRANYR